jgi:CYTH domain-containing protein
VEIERRFLLADVPDGEVLRTVDIDDRYIEATRLRLRRMAERAGPVVFKLTQKLPAPSGPGRHGEQGELTTFYLSEREHATLAALPAAPLCKARLSIAPYGIDVFEGTLAGLVLAEIEFASAAEAAALRPAPFCLAEVTTDRRFAGASLARAARDDVAAWAAEYGVQLAAPATR